MHIEDLIDQSQSMTDEERAYWKESLRSMTLSQRSRLYETLRVERQMIDEIEKKFPEPVRRINTDIDAFEAHVNDGKRILDIISKK